MGSVFHEAVYPIWYGTHPEVFGALEQTEDYVYHLVDMSYDLHFEIIKENQVINYCLKRNFCVGL